MRGSSRRSVIPPGQDPGRGAPGGATAAVRLLLGLGLLLAAPATVAAAPGNPEAPAETVAVALGDGAYDVTGSGFGTERDGLVGETTASGRVLAANDRMVALPACTVSSCPWLPPETGPHAEWGPQESCAEEDGLCWVELTNPANGNCTVAPVLDLGPHFLKDNWWASYERRTYTLDQGVPAAEAALAGADLGFGPGISDRGADVAAGFTVASGIDLAAGTWADLGLDVAQGTAPLRVRMLWQAQVMHWDACGAGTEPAPDAEPAPATAEVPLATQPEPETAPEPDPNATATDDLNLRAGPGIEAAVLAVMPAGARLAVTGPAENGYYPAAFGGERGWAFGDFLALDAGGTVSGSGAGAVAFATDALNVRAGPSLADAVLGELPAGGEVTLTGEARNGFVAVRSDGAAGWVYAAYLDAGGGEVPGADVATVTSELQLRAGPSTDDEVLATMPAGALVTLTGEEANGFRPVRWGEVEGWAFSGWLATEGGGTATTTDALHLRAGPSLADAVVAEVAAGTELTLTGDSINGFRSVQHGEVEGWVFGAYLD